MLTWQQDHLHSLSLKSDLSTAFLDFEVAARELGFDFCCYGLRTPFPISRPRYYVCNNFSSEWDKKYRVNNYWVIDPIVLHAERSVAPIIWSTETFSSAMDLWAEYQLHGLRYGWSQPTHDRRGFVGWLSLARSVGELTQAEVDIHKFMLSWLAQTVHVEMSRQLVPRLEPLAEVKLSPREREVLLWTAEGKTTNDIGTILALSDRTVNFHITNAMTKLCASNKTSAAIKGAMLGLLY